MDIPINIINAICENIFIELFRNRKNTRPPKTARVTVNIIIKGWTNELKVAAITKYAVTNAKAKIRNISLIVSLVLQTYLSKLFDFEEQLSTLRLLNIL